METSWVGNGEDGPTWWMTGWRLSPFRVTVQSFNNQSQITIHSLSPSPKPVAVAHPLTDPPGISIHIDHVLCIRLYSNKLETSCRLHVDGQLQFQHGHYLSSHFHYRSLKSMGAQNRQSDISGPRSGPPALWSVVRLLDFTRLPAASIPVSACFYESPSTSYRRRDRSCFASHGLLIRTAFTTVCFVYRCCSDMIGSAASFPMNHG